VAELVTPQAHIWNETMDQPDFAKFFRVHYALVAKAPAVMYTQRQVLGIQQATSNLQTQVEHEEQAATLVMQQFTNGLVPSLQRSQHKSEGNRSQGSSRSPRYLTGCSNRSCATTAATSSKMGEAAVKD
jgi:hypothetical protein